MDGTRRPTGGVTFLFSDIEGSTRLVRDLGPAGYGPLLERHRLELRGAFRARDGVEIGTEGDSFFVVFERAIDAVVSAAECERRLAAVDWPSGTPIRVRIGIHSGVGLLVDGSYVGADVNRAARIAAAGHGGQIVLSETTAALVAQQLPDGLALRDLGRHRLKDLLPERLWQLDVAGLRSDFPPIRSLDARPNNLPTQLTSFVGREEELGEVRRLLGETRLLTLTGPGGTGKTRLSLQLAAGAAEEFPDGIFFVALEPVREAPLVAPRIAAAVGLSESGSRSAIDLLRDWLPGKRVLLVLDNVEQVVDAAPIVAELLATSETLRIVATSRAPLRVYGEQEFPVRGLPAPPDPGMSAIERARLPGPARTPDVDTVSEFEAVRLFVARAVAVRPGFALTPQNVAAVAAICARLYGVPLAIELAAARVKLLTPDAILERLARQLDLLSGGARDRPQRQQTLRGAIAWSYDLLGDGERRLFERLSVFRGGASLAEIEAIAGPPAELGGDVLDGLLALVDQSLVRTDEDGEPRYDVLEPIREFAFEHLVERGDADELRRRHAQVYAALAERAATELTGPDQRTWLDRLDRDHDNLRAALDRAAEDGDLQLASRVAFALWRFWQQRGHIPEARRRLGELLAQPWRTTDAECRRRLLEAAGGIAYWSNDFANAGRYYTEAAQLARQVGDQPELANALYNLAFAAFRGANAEAPEDDRLAARAALDEALAIYRALDDRHGMAKVLWGIGTIEYFFDHLDETEAPLREALALLETTTDRTMEAWSRYMLAGTWLRFGRLDGVREMLVTALRHFHDAGDLGGTTLCIDGFATLALETGDPERAFRLHGAARALQAASGVELASFSAEKLESGSQARSAALTPERIDVVEAEGRAMSLDEAVAYALDVPIAAIGGPHEHPAGVR